MVVTSQTLKPTPTESLCGKRKERIKMVDFTTLLKKKKAFGKIEQGEM